MRGLPCHQALLAQPDPGGVRRPEAVRARPETTFDVTGVTIESQLNDSALKFLVGDGQPQGRRLLGMHPRRSSVAGVNQEDGV